MKPDIIEAHEKSALEYDKVSQRVDSHGPEILFGLSFEYIHPSESILDVGIGTGLSSALFHKAGLDVYGIDACETMLNVCREKAFAKDLKTLDLSLGNWPYPAGFFDHVICCGVFHFYSDLSVFFKETYRVLKKWGIFGFTVFEKTDDAACESKFEVPLYCHSTKDLDVLFEQFGFSQLKSLSFYTFKTPYKRDRMLFSAYLARKL